MNAPGNRGPQSLGGSGSSGKSRRQPPHWQRRNRSDADAHSSTSSNTPDQNPHIAHPLVTRTPPQVVTTDEQLAELCAHLREAGSFAYDSEFIGELSYFPQLCLIQAASTQRVALIDPLAGLDLTIFWELIADAKTEKIVHAGQQDVEPVFRTIGRPAANIFDTQITSGFVGLGYPLSLSRLLHCMLGVRLSKGLTFTQWDRRPLSDMQLRYAADDVRYLPAIREELKTRLVALGHEQWAREECSRLADPALLTFNPNSQFLKIRGAGALSPKHLATLRELTIWRDAASREENVPPRTFLRDEVLLDLARKPPQVAFDLSQVRGLPRAVEQGHGQAILDAAQRGMSTPVEQCPASQDREPDPREKFRADALWIVVQAIAAGRQIDPALIASRQEIGELSRHLPPAPDADINILHGWRREAVGGPLLELLNGRGELDLRWVGDSLRGAVREV